MRTERAGLQGARGKLQVCWRLPGVPDSPFTGDPALVLVERGLQQKVSEDRPVEGGWAGRCPAESSRV